MEDEVRGNEVSLLITSAEITGVTLQGNHISVDIQLMAGDKPVTTMNLSSWSGEDNLRHIPFSNEMRAIRDQLFKIVRKNAYISLERIANTLPKEGTENE